MTNNVQHNTGLKHQTVNHLIATSQLFYSLFIEHTNTHTHTQTHTLILKFIFILKLLFLLLSYNFFCFTIFTHEPNLCIDLNTHTHKN